MDSADSQDGTVVTTFDPTGTERASEAIVTAVAAVHDTDRKSLGPLYDAVDPDALNALVAHAHRVADAATHELWFVYEGLDIGVRTDGEIHVRDSSTQAK
ncbi:HalOD1 output domain-containing protein [Natronolimnobius sp. AArcel1]|uniref:HalOD1 output domain-containing protein n=1 Tax=Natronolimnobius sp. AArcel1 TaxID=1679093 RepID=UPI003742B6F5